MNTDRTPQAELLCTQLTALYTALLSLTYLTSIPASMPPARPGRRFCIKPFTCAPHPHSSILYIERPGCGFLVDHLAGGPGFDPWCSIHKPNILVRAILGQIECRDSRNRRLMAVNHRNILWFSVKIQQKAYYYRL